MFNPEVLELHIKVFVVIVINHDLKNIMRKDGKELKMRGDFEKSNVYRN